MSKPQIPFIDLKAQQQRIRPQIDTAIKKVLDHGRYLMGPEVYELEEKLASYSSVKNVISCSSGTDALLMILMAKNIGAGDAVFVPNFTFAATPEVVALLGASPIFVDVLADSYNMDFRSLRQGIKIAKERGLKPKAIIAVDLFGQPADYQSIKEVATEHGLWILGDAAQSFGATLNGRKVGSLAFASATSFFPAKPLGCYGDGGAVFTDDDELAEILRSIRVHGEGKDKYDNVRIGLTARLDSFQAAILLEKLKIFDTELQTRQQLATRYNQRLKDIVKVPQLIAGATSTWAQYTIQLPSELHRTNIMANLQEAGVPTRVYYEKPLHQSGAYKKFPTSGELGVGEMLSKRVLSLPISISSDDADYVLDAFCNCIQG